MPTWRILFRQSIFRPCSLAVARVGNSMLANIAMMAMTTRSSISVKALEEFGFDNGRIRGNGLKRAMD